MNDLDKLITEMDFQFFGTGQHKIEPEAFFALESKVILDVRAKEELKP